MLIYKHKQIGTLIRWILGAPAAIIACVAVWQAEARWITAAVVVVLLVSMFLFASLTIEVTDTELRLAFGPGLVLKRFPIADIVDARGVTNPWYYGWGIHLTPRGWLFNVSAQKPWSWT